MRYKNDEEFEESVRRFCSDMYEKTGVALDYIEMVEHLNERRVHDGQPLSE